jgi:hypothetical protein
MVLLVKEYEYTQESNTLYVTVKIPNITPAKADIYSNKHYIKCHYAPYFFELDLWGEIDPDTSSAKVGEGKVVYQLRQLEPDWPQPHYHGADKLERRRRAEEEYLQVIEKV